MDSGSIGKEFVEHKLFNSQERRTLSDKGEAMQDGSFPIRNTADLKRAIQAFGRAKDKAKARAWIIKRAKELNATDILPEGWVDAKQSIPTWKDFLSHHGVKGMKWGVRRSRRQLARAAQSRGRSLNDISDQELRNIVNRMNMEQQYSRLSSDRGRRSLTAAGAAFVGGMALNVVRQQIQGQANQRIGRALAQRSAREAAVRRLARLG